MATVEIKEKYIVALVVLLVAGLILVGSFAPQAMPSAGNSVYAGDNPVVGMNSAATGYVTLIVDSPKAAEVNG